jgi:hypothetical protein
MHSILQMGEWCEGGDCHPRTLFDESREKRPRMSNSYKCTGARIALRLYLASLFMSPFRPANPDLRRLPRVSEASGDLRLQVLRRQNGT